MADDQIPKAGNPKRLHFLHIGKAAGTQIRYLSKQVNRQQRDWKIVKHAHTKHLRDIPPDAAYFFSIRDPLTRFVSGFYSRKRMGRPRLNHRWNDHEKWVFNTFDHANDLAEALFTEGRPGLDATAAMTGVGHLAQNQIDWFESCGALFAIRPPVWIVRQEHFDDDWATLMRRIGFTGTFATAEDEIRAHRNDYTGIPPLSPLAKRNLAAWYARDIAFRALCEDWMASNA